MPAHDRLARDRLGNGMMENYKRVHGMKGHDRPAHDRLARDRLGNGMMENDKRVHGMKGHDSSRHKILSFPLS